MKKLFIIIMVVSLLTMGNALAVTVLQPSVSNACTFDRSALLDSPNEDLIIHISYAADEEYMEVVFGMKVDYSDDLTVTITDQEGNEHVAEILKRDWTTLTVWADNLETLKPHTVTISSVSAKDAEAYPQYAEPGIYAASFMTIPPCCV